MIRLGMTRPGVGSGRLSARPWVIAAAVLVLALAVGCEDAARGTAAPPRPGGTAADYVAAAKGRIDIEGGLVKLAAKRDGLVGAVMVEEGDQVKAGQVLLVLDDEQARLSEQRIVRAPGDGRIVRRTARPGDGVSTLNVTPLFLFAPERPRIVRAELEERFLGRVKPGQPAVVTMEADETQQFPAQVLRLGLVVGQRTPSEDPNERQDNRVVECVLSIDVPELLIGQRVIVRFLKAGSGGAGAG